MIKSADEFIHLRTSGDPAEYNRSAHDEAPIEVWREIIVHRPDFRSWVAHNKTVPVEILAILAHDPSAEVRHCVAMKNKLPRELMIELADDVDQTVRQRIAHNKNAPIEALRKLTTDEVRDISEHAKARLAAATSDPTA
jgi:hypothetical protein